jgi:DNA-binding transcriptional regulator YhcF (GntR family)
MSQKQLIAAIDQRFRALNRRERITKIRELASESPADNRFMQKTFPELYREAFQTTRRGAGVRSGVARKRGRAGALRSK